MAKISRTVTITILPGATERSIQWTLPRWMFHLVILGFVLFLVGIGAMVFFYVVEARKFVFYHNLIRETQTQGVHLQSYRKKLEQLEAELSQVNLLDGQISRMTEGSNGGSLSGKTGEQQGVTGKSSTLSSTDSDRTKDRESPSDGRPVRESLSGGRKMDWSHFELPGQWQMPISGWITSPFGARKSLLGTGQEFHPGIDIAQEEGQPVLAPSDGLVLRTGFASDYGRFVMLFHGLGLTSLYAHLGKIEVTSGEMVRRGTVLGTVGLSGMTNGPHLHFELRKFGKAEDPSVFLSRAMSD